MVLNIGIIFNIVIISNVTDKIKYCCPLSNQVFMRILMQICIKHNFVVIKLLLNLKFQGPRFLEISALLGSRILSRRIRE